jgi:hypothetical protein
MARTPALFYTLGHLLFGLALTSFSPCTKCYKRAIVGTSTPLYFVYTHQTGQMLHRLIYSQVSEVAGK